MSDEKIKCEICGALAHAIQTHLEQVHPEISLDEYKAKFPNAPVYSELAQRKIAEKMVERGAMKVAMASAPVLEAGKGFLHEVFKLGVIKEAMSGRGDPIPITLITKTDHPEFIPPVDDNHVFDVDLLKNCLMAFELGIPLYGWGHKGAGKTTTLEQICARTGRPMLRIQHTINSEESHFVGQWLIRGGETIFQPGPLAMAMRYGWIYLADEYDFALPSVLSVYQPILEGKSLVIKEAAGTEWAVVKPHSNFRFAATGNTNGSGDETGLYQGTQIQNSANYDRFGVVVKVNYMQPALEKKILEAQAKIKPVDSGKLVDFANLIRESYDGNKMSDTISPRALINAARLGLRRGSFRVGLALAFINKLNKVDREVADGVAQRVFGS